MRLTSSISLPVCSGALRGL